MPEWLEWFVARAENLPEKIEFWEVPPGFLTSGQQIFSFTAPDGSILPDRLICYLQKGNRVATVEFRPSEGKAAFDAALDTSLVLLANSVL